MKLIEIEKIIAKVKTDHNIDEPEYTLLSWAGEALDAVKAPKMLETVTRIVQISDYRGLLPSDVIYINQIVKYNKSLKKKSICDTINTVQQDTDAIEVQNNYCCQHYEEEDYDIQNCLAGLVLTGCNFTSTGNNLFEPVRKTTNNFFDATRCDGLVPCKYEYRISGSIIYTSFKEGNLLVSYQRFYRNEDSVLLIPDRRSVKEAIVRYIILKHVEKKLYSYDKFTEYRVAAAKVNKATADWHWYARQAKNEMMALDIDDMQNLTESSNRSVDIKDYYEYFASLNSSNYGTR